MDRQYLCSKINEAIAQFNFKGEYISHKPFGSGHINDTFCVQFTDIKYILQRINHEVFKNPEKVMENIVGVTNFLKKKGVLTLTIIKTKNNASFYRDDIGSYWRAYDFIDGASTYDTVEKIEHLTQSGIAFGNFQQQLSDYPAETLFETIPDFHNTPARFETLKKAVNDDIMGRANEVKPEIDFLMARESDVSIMTDMLQKGELPLRVTLNDTKLNNVMIDDITGEGICVIDLDTVMPGLAANDFGDAIRFGCNPVLEDETDLSKVIFNIEYYKAFTKGFMSACGNSLTENETATLPLGAKLMTLENGIRFLTDYLSGDTYFKIHREKQNLDRCRTQLELVKQMEEHMDILNQIITDSIKRTD